MASLFKRGDWYCASFYSSKRSPKQKQLALGTKIKREAERLLHDLEADFDRGSFDPWDDKQPQHEADLRVLQKAVDAFIDSRSNLSPYTITKYRSVLGLLVEHLGECFRVQRITADRIQEFLGSTDKQPVTKKTYNGTLSPFFNWLIARDVIENNPTEHVRLQRVPQKFPRFLKPGDVGKICEAIKARQKEAHVSSDAGEWLLPVVQANVYLGLRAGELVNLRWEHVDLERRTLRVANSEKFETKSGKERTIPLSDPVVKILADLDDSTDYVFPSHNGAQIHRHYLSRAFTKYARSAGVTNVSFHTTRHTACSWLAMQGASAEAIRLFAGHSSITVTQRYMHLSPEAHFTQVNAAFCSIPRGETEHINS